jgi:multiple sugar transport system permease protein
MSSTVSPTSGFWKRNQQRLAPWLFLAPGMIMFAIYVIIPIFQSIWISFYDWDGLGPKTWIGVANYVELLDDEAFYTSLKNNILWLVLYLLAVPAGLAVALFLNQTVAGIRLYKSLFFFPFVISQVVVGLIFTWFYAPDFGLLSALIKTLTGHSIAILADERYVTLGIIAAGLWPQIAYCMILYLTGGGRAHGRRERLVAAVAHYPAAARPRHLHCHRRHRHRCVAFLRPCLDHDGWWPLRLEPRAFVLHV